MTKYWKDSVCTSELERDSFISGNVDCLRSPFYNDKYFEGVMIGYRTTYETFPSDLSKFLSNDNVSSVVNKPLFLYNTDWEILRNYSALGSCFLFSWLTFTSNDSKFSNN